MSQLPETQRSPSPRVQKKREQARREILSVARALLANGGMEAVTLASVAAELGVTKQALYHYFPSKDALTRGLVAALIDHEVETLVAVIDAVEAGKSPLGTLIRAFYEHYIDNLDEFRAVYCQLQLNKAAHQTMDAQTIRDDINPRTKHLFDRLQEKLATGSVSKARQDELRRIAFTAWSSALGLVAIRGVTEALNDPLVHADEDLLDTLAAVFDQAAPG